MGPVVWLVALWATAASAQGPVRLAVVSFEDRAGFEGRWQLARDVPRLLAERLVGLSPLAVTPPDSAFAAESEARREGLEGRELALAAARRLDVDLVVRGRVEACGVRRVVAGDPNLGGYKSYTYRLALREVELIRVGTQEVLRTLEVERDSVSRPLELNVFGKPGDSDREFRKLFEVDFGSPPFLELGFGRFATAAVGELASDIVSTVYDRPPLDLSREGAQVLAVDGRQVFLGIGADDGLATADRLPLLGGGGERVAVVVVEELIGPHLSKARLLASMGTVEAGCRIGQRLPPETTAD